MRVTAEHADLIFTNGAVLTHTSEQATTVAVGGGKIIAVGGQEVCELGNKNTEIVDLAGKPLLPGFVDAHVHPFLAGLGRLQCDLTGVHSLEGYSKLIRAYAAKHIGEWIEGSGWYGDVFPGGYPTKETLDEIVSDRPCVLTSHDVHSVWVNSRALEIAEIDRHTADPEGGRILRNSDGEPSGLLMESAIDLLDGVRPKVSKADLHAALMEAQRYLHSVGVTAWQDALVGEVFGIPDAFEVYEAADASGALLSRVTTALFVPPGEQDMNWLETFEQRRSGKYRRLQATAAKVLLDGNCENMTGAVHEAYVGHPNEHGILQFEPDELNQIAHLLHSREFDLHIHAVGDRAVTVALDALEPLANLGGRRHQIAHIDLIRPNDIARMSTLGIIANVSPLWARLDPVLVETKLPLLTSSQQATHFAFGSLDRAGVELAFGSDWPVSTPNPFEAIHTAVNRTAAPDDPHADDLRSLTEPLLPAEGISLSQALHAYTLSAARASGLDAFAGSIEVGKDADLVVLDRDPFGGQPEQIGTVRTEQTYIDGRLVYSLD